MGWASWIRNGKHSLERRWALYQALRRKAVSRRLATRPCLEILEDRYLLTPYIVTNTNNTGSGSFYDAITQANNTSNGITEIDFNIGAKGVSSGVQTIIPGVNQLPALTANGVFINGYSENQFQGVTSTSPLIELGSLLGGGAGLDGLILTGTNNTVSGLSITRFETGIEVEGSRNTIGGTTTGAGNVLSDNVANLVIASGASGVVVQGNNIGTENKGTGFIGNSGIEVDGSNNTIGGSVAGSGNTIVGDALGIEVDGSNNIIGSSVAGAGNTIADNSGGGVLVNKGIGDTIRSNTIFANGSKGTGPGIDLSNGGNNNLAAPSLNSATLNGNTLTVTGSFNSPSANTYVLDFYDNSSTDPEGGGYLGSLTVTPTSTGTQSFTFTTTTTGIGIDIDPLITATLTDSSGDTSPFSNGAGVLTAPTVASNPGSVTVTADFDAEFTASAYGFPPPTVQWQVSYDGGETFTNIAGATSTTLALYAVWTGLNGSEYRAVFTNSSGSATTSAATLTVNATAAPAITSNPSSQTVTAGQTATFTASASGNPAPIVQWQVSTDGGKTFTNIFGARSAPLTLSGVTAAMSGYEYQAVFSNGVGAATTAAATLTVLYAPTVTTSPTSTTVTAGQTATFTASASGNPTPTVQWQVSSDGGNTFTNISGATSTTLTLNNVTTTMSGYEYQAVFTNSIGGSTTNSATLTVNAPVAPAVTSSPSSQTVTGGQSATFTASASGNPTPTAQWQVSSDGGNTFTNITGATSTTLTLNNVTTAMSGYLYQVVFTNNAGFVKSSAATLTINGVAPIITSNPNNQTVTAGQSATFTASAGGSPTPAVQWQVSSDGGKTFANISGAANITLTLNHVTIAMSGYEYQAVFTNSAGTAATSAATLTVNPDPPVSSPPSPLAPPVLNLPPLLAFFDSLLGGIETVNANRTETITDSFLGIPLIVSAFDSDGNLMSVDLFGFFNITFLFV